MESVRLSKGLRCRIDVPEGRKETRVTVAAVRGAQEAAAEPFTLTDRPSSARR
jgi:hypothetical protein